MRIEKDPFVIHVFFSEGAERKGFKSVFKTVEPAVDKSKKHWSTYRDPDPPGKLGTIDDPSLTNQLEQTFLFGDAGRHAAEKLGVRSRL